MKNRIKFPLVIILISTIFSYANSYDDFKNAIYSMDSKRVDQIIKDSGDFLPNNPFEIALHDVIFKNANIEIIDFIITKVEKNIISEQTLEDTFRRSDIEVLKLLLKKGGIVTERVLSECIAVMIGTDEDHIMELDFEKIKLLFENGGKLTAKILIEAFQLNKILLPKTEKIEFLLTVGGGITEELLYDVVSLSEYYTLKFLVEKGAIITEKILRKANKLKNREIIKFLKEKIKETEISYLDPPTITSISPNSGPSVGGTVVLICGTNLEEVSYVKFGPYNASFKIQSPEHITAIVSHGTPDSTVDISLGNIAGSSSISPSTQFYYQKVQYPPLKDLLDQIIIAIYAGDIERIKSLINIIYEKEDEKSFQDICSALLDIAYSNKDTIKNAITIIYAVHQNIL